ncbi:MerR family transcriptional regulator [Delftia sp. Cs1-4]|uniref:chaperone modulator CbpM n=1 Tax=Delftia sp. (strain Cs1-4) TaxID=742013 RepID=UPI00020E852B|nr:chaperone modulator CbpM [Delftia sp. Cs1-4]AEF90751.1 MerR family transcriptional regulator [Delftia sp. Cs1-4]
MSTPLYPFYEPAELLDEGALDLQDLARHCQRNTAWVVERVQTGVLYCENEPSDEAAAPQAQWRFSSQTLVRARRIAHLEHSFDADPQLAALTADLIEEVQMLRRKLQALQH